MRPGRTSSPRTRAALALLGLLLFPLAASAAPDYVLPQVDAAAPSYAGAYVAFGAGIALTAGSFVLAGSADRSYERYLAASDPGAIKTAYDDARRLDHWSAGVLLAGTGALALGVYWRFIRRPAAPRGAALEFEVEPHLTPHHAGLALSLRFP
ncbi:MAG: hypothetical protein ABI960_06025 [Candidatus Eisenbacteria bacterium]